MRRGARPPTLRARLTRSYIAAFAALLTLYAGGVFVLLRQSLFSELDRQLYDDGEHAEDMLTRSDAGAQVTWREGGHDGDEDDRNRWLEVWSPAGTVLYRSAGAGRLPLDAEQPARPDETTKSVTTRGGAELRVQERQAFVEGQAVLMRVARSEEPLRGELGRIGLILGLGMPVGIVAAAVVGNRLARRDLAPLAALAAQAQEITADRLTDRLPIDRHDELGRVAVAFNAALARLEQSFEQMRRFTSDASHELRTPLTVVRAVGEVGLQEPRTPEGYREIIGSMLEEVDRLGALVDNLLALSRADTGQAKLRRVPINFSAVVDATAAQLLVLAEEKTQRLVVHLPGHPVMVLADAAILRRAVVNLLDNAIKYAPTNSSIEVGLTAEHQHAVLTVQDQGPGISAEDQAHIFERFYRADRARSRATDGAGLGLAIAHSVVDAHGGRITVESVEGHGSTFRVVLPLSALGAPKAAP